MPKEAEQGLVHAIVNLPREFVVDIIEDVTKRGGQKPKIKNNLPEELVVMIDKIAEETTQYLKNFK